MLSIMGVLASLSLHEECTCSIASIVFISSLNTATTLQLYLAEHSTYPLFQCFFTKLTISRFLSLFSALCGAHKELPPEVEGNANCWRAPVEPDPLDPTVFAFELHSRSCLLPTTNIGTFRMSRLSYICSLMVFTYWKVSTLDRSNTSM